jgi:hypothetical protein
MDELQPAVITEEIRRGTVTWDDSLEFLDVLTPDEADAIHAEADVLFARYEPALRAYVADNMRDGANDTGLWEFFQPIAREMLLFLLERFPEEAPVNILAAALTQIRAAFLHRNVGKCVREHVCVAISLVEATDWVAEYAEQAEGWEYAVSDRAFRQRIRHLCAHLQSAEKVRDLIYSTETHDGFKVGVEH